MFLATKAVSYVIEHSFVLLVATIVISTFTLYSHFRLRRVLDSFPLARKELGSAYARRNEFLKDPMRAYREGYERFKGKAFRVTHYEGQFFHRPRQLSWDLFAQFKADVFLQRL